MSGRVLHILIVEEDIRDFVELNESLNKSFKNIQLVYCQHLEKAVEISSSVDFDVLITSSDFAKSAERALFDKIIQKSDAPAIILLIDYLDEKLSLEWIAAGVQDCIPKENLNNRVLYKSVTYAVARRMKGLSVLTTAQRYRNLFAQNPLPVLAYEIDSKKILLANDAAELFYGYSQLELIQLKISNLQFDNELSAGIFTGQKKHRTKNGKLISVEIFTSLIKINQKTCRQIVVVDQSEIAQKQTENGKEIQQLLLLQSAISKSADGIIIARNVNDNFCSSEILYSNAAFNHLAGFTSAEITGQKPEQLHKKYPVKEASSDLLPAEIFETRFINHQNNQEIWVDYSVSAVTDAGGNISHFVAVYRDVSDRKKAAAETANLIKSLEQTNQELKQFSYVISHNLRAPLANLNGLLGLLDVETIQDTDTLELIEAVKSSTHKLNVTVNDIIDVLLIQSEDSHIPELLPLAAAWEKVKSTLAYLIETADAQFVENFAEAPQILFTETYLESILANFLSNALKYKSDDRQLIINLKTYEEPDFTVLIFEDNGIGIDMNRYGSQVFGLYKRFSNKAEGKGLGLYIVQAQVTAMGGKIKVKSELNKGTRFTVFFKK